jgi:hypothetical protein
MIRYQVKFPPARRMGVILHLGVIAPPEPAIKTEEAIGLIGGGSLLVGGLAVKGKGGMVMAILGGLAALISGGMVAVRAISPKGPAVVGPPVVAPQGRQIPGLPPSTNALINQLLPVASNLFKPGTPAAPAPSAIVTSIPGTYGTPYTPAYSPPKPTATSSSNPYGIVTEADITPPSPAMVTSYDEFGG